VPEPFQYTLLRVVPDLSRGERINAGVVVFCRTRGYLAARVGLDRARLAAVAPGAEIEADAIERTLAGLASVAAGEPAGGPISALPPSERFHWLAAPASTVVQPSPVHTGLCEDPADVLDRLFTALVL
jgi:hypothetical protein